MNWYLEVLKKYAVFSGRARRKEYWFFVLFSAIVSIILTVLDVLLGTYNEETQAGVLSSLYSLGVFIPSIAVTVRRLHDTDRSGWWILMPFAVIIVVGIVAAVLIPSISENTDEASKGIIILLLLVLAFAAFITMFVFMVLDSTPGTNRYGKNPKNFDEPVFDNKIPLQQFQEKTTLNSNSGSITLLGVVSGIPPIVLPPNLEVIVGRSPNVNLQIDNKYISNRHLSLTANSNGTVKVRDLDSSNGTYIDGKKLDSNISYTLSSGERLIIGSEDVVYTL